VPGGLKDQRDGGGSFEREIFWIGEAVYFWAADEFGAAAVGQVAEICELRALIVISCQTRRAFSTAYSGSQQNFLPGLYRYGIWADFGDDTGDVAAGNVRERKCYAMDSLANPEIQVIQGAGVDADENFARAEFGFGGVGVVEDFGTAVVIEEDGFQAVLLLSAERYVSGEDAESPIRRASVQKKLGVRHS